MKTNWGEIKTIQIDEYYKLDPNKINVPIQILITSRERGKTLSITTALWNHVMYKKFRTRISHITHSRRRIRKCLKCVSSQK